MSDLNRIDRCFSALKSEGKSAFVAYVCAGDPNMTQSLEIMKALEAAGVDIIELGVPFSDPMADGVVNQMAAHRALEAGASFPKVLDLIRKFRETSEVPLVLFTYLNPVYTYGFGRFHKDSAAAGVDGVLLLDLPPEELARNRDIRETPELKHIRLIAPTTPEERIPQLAASAEGFIYYVSREGVTGAQSSLATGIEKNVANIQKHTKVPVVVGFGISTPEQSAAVAKIAAGVVVGSAIVQIVAQNAASPDVATKVGAFVKPLVDAAKLI